MRSSICRLIFGFALFTTPVIASAQGRETGSLRIVSALADSSVTVQSDAGMASPESGVKATGKSGTTGTITIGVARLQASPDTAQAEEGGIKNFFFGTQRRASNTLLIGGVATSAIGVGVVKGHAGAILGVLGLMASVGGMYLAF